ncbi:hypothetical protein VaNZ11_006493 [Volvox africanus]|uniref:Uncharacterized protein n=1 Tax=Volvox africanus TaxID=51714 RepID=A0ABQ5S196_9CHLO|nr:hypothetical protein VaNZ11_006493 [Volvox africanus]
MLPVTSANAGACRMMRQGTSTIRLYTSPPANMYICSCVWFVAYPIPLPAFALSPVPAPPTHKPQIFADHESAIQVALVLEQQHQQQGPRRQLVLAAAVKRSGNEPPHLIWRPISSL